MRLDLYLFGGEVEHRHYVKAIHVSLNVMEVTFYNKLSAEFIRMGKVREYKLERYPETQ
jgi:hypothetical protein